MLCEIQHVRDVCVCPRSLNTLRMITRLLFTCYNCYKFCASETVSALHGGGGGGGGVVSGK